MLNTRKKNKASHSCECCDKFKEEIVDLKIENQHSASTCYIRQTKKTKGSLGKNNLDIILGKQRCVFDKAGLGYNLENKKKMHKNFFSSTQKTSSPFLTCFYCGKKDHSASTCYIRKNDNSIGKMV